MAEQKQVNKAAFLKNLNKKKAAAKVAAKAERPTGIMDAAAMMARLGLENENDRVTLAARVSKINFGYAKDDANKPYFRFAYSLSEDSPLSGKGKGMIVSNYHELTQAEKDGEVWRTEEQAFERMYFEFQGLGENTAEWEDPISEAVEAAERHTAEKTEIQVSLSVYSGKNGLGLNISVVNVMNNDDLDDSDEDSSEGSDEGSDEGSYEDWVGGWVTYTDDEGSVDFLIDSYDSENDTFTGKDEDDGEWTAPCDECEWCENQRDE